MKILLMGDASNYHRALASGLRRIGHEVTLASHGSLWMNTERDIDLSRPFPGRLGGAALWLKARKMLLRELRGYDIVQICGPGFISLKPGRIKDVFDGLRRHNGSVFMTALGTDTKYVDICTDAQRSPLRYTEWLADGRPSGMTPEEATPWLTPEMRRFTDYIYNNVKGIVAALYEYYRVCEAVSPGVPLAYGGIPVDMSELPRLKRERKEGEPVRIFLAAHSSREVEKGMDRLRPMLEGLAARYPGQVELLSPPNMPYGEFVKFLGTTDIVVDQLYSYTPATTALVAMGMGVVPVSGAEPEYLEFIGEKGDVPIVNPDPMDLSGAERRLEEIICHPGELREMSAAAMEFVRRHNEAELVARRFEDFWQANA